jgi:hypothetical protein
METAKKNAPRRPVSRRALARRIGRSTYAGFLGFGSVVLLAAAVAAVWYYFRTNRKAVQGKPLAERPLLNLYVSIRNKQSGGYMIFCEDCGGCASEQDGRVFMDDVNYVDKWVLKPTDDGRSVYITPAEDPDRYVDACPGNLCSVANVPKEYQIGEAVLGVVTCLTKVNSTPVSSRQFVGKRSDDGETWTFQNVRSQAYLGVTSLPYATGFQIATYKIIDDSEIPDECRWYVQKEDTPDRIEL